MQVFYPWQMDGGGGGGGEFASGWDGVDRIGRWEGEGGWRQKKGGNERGIEKDWWLERLMGKVIMLKGVKRVKNKSGWEEWVGRSCEKRKCCKK